MGNDPDVCPTPPRLCPNCGRGYLVVEAIVHKPGREVVRESCRFCNYFLGYIRKQIREES